ncbi:hypothetical protein ABZ208_19165 [Streptomyces sp. NPDC006208]|uniref:hypothetical protein n=1 Tax=Streptomyces sp. NPDC006208 TaxID=3156734 RepID=UPI0033BC82EF
MNKSNGEVGVLGAETDRVNRLTRAMITEYGEWGSKISVGEVQQGMYDDILDFLNFRIETAESCLILADNRKTSDALGLNRSLLEHYLLFMLICRGTKFFRLQDLTSLTSGQFKARLAEEQEQLRIRQSEGEVSYLEVRKYRRATRHLMYVFEGLKDREDPGFIVPIHYFHFQEFRPDVMRLDNEDYFQYYKHEPETIAALQGHRDEAKLSYRHYLSYEALLQCLELNELVDAATIARIEAHYTFLGQFLHPTHNAARSLHDRDNYHMGGTSVGIRQPYSEVANLLAALYTCYVVAGLIEEAAGLIENAPTKYISQAGTEDARALTGSVADQFPYFWFLFNDPPLYDRFNYCIHHATDDELTEWGSYANVPKDRVPFDQHIYNHLKSALGGWSNARCGVYSPPVQ